MTQSTARCWLVENNKRNYVNRWAQSLGQSTWQVRHSLLQRCRLKDTTASQGTVVPLDFNSPMDPMTGTIPITLGEYPKGFWGLGKGLMTIAHVFPLIIAAEQRIPSVTKDLNHLPPTYEGCFHCLHGKCLRIWWVYRFWLKEARQKVSKNT